MRAATDSRRDLLWLLALALVMMASGLGLRDPWPADEPRFALIARDMVASGQWLIPSVGGDWYPDKPPFYFWLISMALSSTGSLRVAFLMPSLLAGLGTLVLVHDLARRLWDRDTARFAGLMLLLTVQFIWQTRQAQIDATLCFWTTLGLYGLLRHLLLGPQWRWYAIGWAACGFGIITKGVGFLPLLLFIPYLASQWGTWSVATAHGVVSPTSLPSPSLLPTWLRWWLGPLAFLAAVSVWLVPMLLATSSDPELLAYRNEILFQQTVHRYADAWHHREPFWFFIVEVIPALWLPLTAFLPWLIPRWRALLKGGDRRILLLLSWVGLVVLFFSLSTGKRGVYVLPAVPALVLACAPALRELLAKKGPQSVLFGLALTVAVIALLAAGYLWSDPAQRGKLLAQYALDPLPVLLVIGAAVSVVAACCRPQRGVWAWGATLVVVMLVIGFWINPALNDERSSRRFVGQVQAAAADVSELGLVGYKEQYLLYFGRPIVNFGHARWREFEQEAYDAAAWMNQRSGRGLLLDERVKTLCFPEAAARAVGPANGSKWFVVTGSATVKCAAAGNLANARTYRSSGTR